MLESKFQSDLKKELKNKFPGCIVMKADSQTFKAFLTF